MSGMNGTRRPRSQRDQQKHDELKRAIVISAEIHKEGGDAEQRLNDKCYWEHMSRLGVILEWGDPREWE